jgi:hypothetical protein
VGVERDSCLVEATRVLSKLGYRVFSLGRNRPAAVAVGSKEVAVWLIPKMWTNGRWQAKITKASCERRGLAFDNHFFFNYKLPVRGS